MRCPGWIYQQMLHRYGWLYIIELNFTSLKSIEIALFTSVTSHVKLEHKNSNSSLNKGHAFINMRSHWKLYRPVQARIYRSCEELAFWVDVFVNNKLQPFTHTAWYNFVTVVVVAKQMASVWALIHYAIRRLIAKSRKVAKPWDWVLLWPYRSDIWQASQ